MKSLNSKVANDKEKVAIETEEKLREVRLHYEILGENRKREISQRVELEHQRKLNELQLGLYTKQRDNEMKRVDKYQLEGNSQLLEDKR